MKHFALPDWQNAMIGGKYHDIKNKKGKNYIHIGKILIFVGEKHCLL